MCVVDSLHAVSRDSVVVVFAIRAFCFHLNVLNLISAKFKELSGSLWGNSCSFPSAHYMCFSSVSDCQFRYTKVILLHILNPDYLENTIGWNEIFIHKKQLKRNMFETALQKIFVISGYYNMSVCHQNGANSVP